MKRECCGKVACIRIERQGEFGLSPDLFRIQTRLPLRPSTNMSHTTYVKHTGYQVNIIHHESHVSSNNKQYSTIHMPMSYSTPKPCGWQRDPTWNRRQLRGWVGGKLIDGVTFGARSKSGASSIGIRTACSNTDAGPAVPAVAALLRCTDGIPSAHVRNRRISFWPTLAGPNQRK